MFWLLKNRGTIHQFACLKSFPCENKSLFFNERFLRSHSILVVLATFLLAFLWEVFRYRYKLLRACNIHSILFMQSTWTGWEVCLNVCRKMLRKLARLGTYGTNIRGIGFKQIGMTSVTKCSSTKITSQQPTNMKRRSIYWNNTGVVLAQRNGKYYNY